MILRITKSKKNKQEYRDYLQSSAWKLFRQRAFDHYGSRCMKCGSVDNLQVHHKHYKTLFSEELKDVEVLCSTCHRGTHKKKLWKNGKQSKYMTHPHYDQQTVTYIIPKRNGQAI